MNLRNLTVVETAPELEEPFAPPAGWEGDYEAYKLLICGRMKACPLTAQYIGILAHSNSNSGVWGNVQFKGPHAVWAQKLLPGIARRLREKTKARAATQEH